MANMLMFRENSFWDGSDLVRSLLFSDRYKSECLDDIPPMSAVVQDPKEFYGKLPGQVINRDEQCKMIFGKSFYACPQRLVSNAVNDIVTKATHNIPWHRISLSFFLVISTDILCNFRMYERWLQLLCIFNGCSRWNTMRR